MTPKLRVSFNSPQSGFMSIGLDAGAAHFVTAVAHLPYDSLRDLITALSALCAGEKKVVVKWNCEPEEYDFEFHRKGGEAELNIVRFPNHQRLNSKREIVFSYSDSAANICESFRVALSELYMDRNVDEFDKNWRREFPEEAMRELTSRLKTVKQPHSQE